MSNLKMFTLFRLSFYIIFIPFTHSCAPVPVGISISGIVSIFYHFLFP